MGKRSLPEKYKIKSEDEKRIILQSKQSFNQRFGGWFGSELISIQQKDDKIIIRGPLQHINAVDSDLRFESLQVDH